MYHHAHAILPTRNVLYGPEWLTCALSSQVQPELEIMSVGLSADDAPGAATPASGTKSGIKQEVSAARRRPAPHYTACVFNSLLAGSNLSHREQSK